MSRLSKITHFYLLKDRYLRDLWRGLWLSVAMASIVNGFFGTSGDWFRLAMYTAVLTTSQAIAYRQPMYAVLGHNLFSFVIYSWMSADPHSVLQRMNLGLLAYGFLATTSVLGMGFYLGPSAGVLGVLVAGLLLITQTTSPQWPFVLLQLFSGAIIGTLIHKLVRDLEDAREQLEHVALTDVLTGLSNRNALPIRFAEYLAMSARQGKPLLVSLWDLNNLKCINDTLGHAVGDAHIRSFAQVLLRQSRQEDLFFRTGGDEFVGLHFDSANGDVLRNRVQACFPDVAVGWSLVLEDLDSTLQAADQMMYEAKKRQKAEAVG